MMNTNGGGPTAAPMAKQETGSAMMVLGTDAYRGALEPQTTGDAFHIAEMMASIGYCGVTSAPEALGRIMTGRGLGLSAMQSMRGIYTVNGRPGIDAALMHALCLQSPLCEYFDIVAPECDETKATFVAKRVGRPEVKHVFTIEQAEKMGVVGRGDDEKAKAANNWTKVRAAMLRARCKSELARIVFPDLIFGMYSKEELEVAHDELPKASPQDPNELAGEILSAEEAAIEAARRAQPSPIQAAKRDYAKEGDALIAQGRAARSRVEHAAVRDAINAWDAVDPHKSRVIAAYNEAKKAQKEAAAQAGEAAPAADGSAPSPLPEGNLFTKPEPAKP